MNYYEQAIDVLMKTKDAKVLLFEIAKKNPGAVVSAHERVYGPFIENKIRKMFSSGAAKLQCIKAYRDETGASLRDSKDFVEKVIGA